MTSDADRDLGLADDPASLAQIEAIAQTMARGGHDAIGLSTELLELVRRLPPSRELMKSRPVFERANLWRYAASFENVNVTGVEPPSEVIRMRHDGWVRTVNSTAILKFEDAAAAANFSRFTRVYGLAGRGFFETNWRIDSKQGFQYSGRTEVLENAARITGEGQFRRPLDWTLENNQTIDVRVRSLLGDIFTSDFLESLNIQIRWIVVTFGVEEIRNAAKAARG